MSCTNLFPDESNMKKVLLLTTLFILFSVASFAQMPGGMPPGGMGGMMPGIDKSGRIDGTIFKLDPSGKKIPVPNQKITLVVMQGDQQILALEKISDDKGHFGFVNIFKDPTFGYAFGTFYEDNLYVHPRVSLNKDESVKTVELPVGENSPYLRDKNMMQEPPPGGSGSMDGEDDSSGGMSGGMPPPGKPGKHGHGQEWSRPFQVGAIALAILVCVMGAYYMGKRSE